ncbi:FAD-dependent monooxygenase [Pseudomonas lalucatii]|nr:FAD-dependent monooxygenase [Pseudomonas lalucatii]
MRVLVVGAGAIGLLSARLLAEAGAEVCLVDQSVTGSPPGPGAASSRPSTLGVTVRRSRHWRTGRRTITRGWGRSYGTTRESIPRSMSPGSTGWTWKMRRRPWHGRCACSDRCYLCRSRRCDARSLHWPRGSPGRCICRM